MPFNNFKFQISASIRRVYYFKLKSGGFSLVELLLSLSLIGLVVVVALPNLKSFSKTQEIDATAARLVDILENAQSSASSHIQCPGGQAAGNWSLVLGANDYTLNCKPSPTAAIPLPADQMVSTGAYKGDPNSATAFTAAIDKCLPITFTFTNQQTVALCSGSNALPVTITLSGGNADPKRIMVGTGGVVRIVTDP
jgi:type II secretory pathway pseudopilin PulG